VAEKKRVTAAENTTPRSRATTPQRPQPHFFYHTADATFNPTPRNTKTMRVTIFAPPHKRPQDQGKNPAAQPPKQKIQNNNNKDKTHPT